MDLLAQREEGTVAWIEGLPASAHERVERQRASGTAGSLLSAPAAASVRAAGLAPVGEVFGALVMNLGWSGGYCGAYSYGYGGGMFGVGATTPVVTSGDAGGRQNGFGPYVAAVRQAWNGALARLRTEARILGADGVVGIRTGRTAIDGRAEEFTALGTAVRVVDPAMQAALVRDDLWTAGLSGEDCAAAILSGYAPLGMAMGLSVATKHEDWQMQGQRSSWSNTEVTGLTALLQAARSDARRQLAASAGRLGGGDLVVTGSSLRDFDTACGGSEQKDVHAESMFTGTVLATVAGGPRAARGGRRAPLTVLPLSGAGAGTRRRDPRHG